jgi:hypothetical protein
MGTAKTEKKDEDKPTEETKEEETPKKDPATLTLEDVREHCRLLERSVVSKESRFAVRVMRGLPATRKKLTTPILKRIITGFYTHSAVERDTLLGYIPDEVSIVNCAVVKKLYNELQKILYIEYVFIVDN